MAGFHQRYPTTVFLQQKQHANDMNILGQLGSGDAVSAAGFFPCLQLEHSAKVGSALLRLNRGEKYL